MSQLMMRAHSCLRLRKLTLNKNASASIVNRAVRNSSTRSQLSSDDQAAAAASGNEQSANVILMKILHMIRSFRNRGHFAASLDPLAVVSRNRKFKVLTVEQTPCRTSGYIQNTPIYSTNAPASNAKHLQDLKNENTKYINEVSSSTTGEKMEQVLESEGPSPSGSACINRLSSWLPENESHHPDVVRMLKNYPVLDLSVFGLEDVRMDEKYEIGDELSQTINGASSWTISELVNALIEIYCGNVGAEYLHIENELQRNWLKNKIEGEYGASGWSQSCKKEQIAQYRTLLSSDYTARFLNYKFRNAKVFGIEGCDSLMPGLMSTVKVASALGVEGIEMGMAHRGRMNILHNFFQKPLKSIISMFSEAEPSELGDVKYHLGTRAELSILGTDGVQRTMHLSLAANPSHLEAVYPVVIGKTKAKQFFINDFERRKVMPIVLHGDAAFSGQGIVPEVMELSDLPDYTVGGCIHIVLNNQIGFTTDPRLARSSYHCTNVAKGVGAPIFHVNGDDVDAVSAVCRLAVEWRQEFRRDCVVDIVCYRRHGHNSQDDPSITQPLIYDSIKNHPATLEIYQNQLISQGTMTLQQCEDMRTSLWSLYEKEYLDHLGYKADPLEWLASNWQGAAIGSLIARRPYNQTGVKLETLYQVGHSLVRIPDNFELHSDIQRLLVNRKKALDTGKGVSMGFAESLAFGCLMNKFSPDHIPGLRGLPIEKRTLSKALDQDVEFSKLDIALQEHPTVHIRLSGQDCIRGTFNQRHAAIICQKSGQSYWQLNDLNVAEQATISVCNSSLSEAAILGFEYGYSLSNEMALTIWEAQFGDFANVAQAIIDNFIASGESKWNNQSSLVLLLPHGYDGQGPEHSSARLERFLQLMDDDCDIIPGSSNTISRQEMSEGFDALDKNKAGFVTRDVFIKVMLRYTPSLSSERADLIMAEILSDLNSDCTDKSAHTENERESGGGKRDGKNSESDSPVFTKEAWCNYMASWLQANSERRHNLIVVVPSSPAQYFHCLRRQIHRPFTKPLVVMSAKWLLHHKACTSRVDDMGPGTYFLRIILEGGRGDNMRNINSNKKTNLTSECGSVDENENEKNDRNEKKSSVENEQTDNEKNQNVDDDNEEEELETEVEKGVQNELEHAEDREGAKKKGLALLPSNEIKRIIFCSGKVFYHLYHARAAASIKNITIVRVEQVAPFPYDLLGPAILKFPNAELVWVQEEPKNMGAWTYVKPRFDTTLREGKILRDPIRYIGRKPAAAAATGGYKNHVSEQKEFIDRALAFDE